MGYMQVGDRRGSGAHGDGVRGRSRHHGPRPHAAGALAILLLAGPGLGCAGGNDPSPTAPSGPLAAAALAPSDGKPGHAGGGGKTTPTVELSGALLTASPQPLSYFKNNKRQVAAGGDIEVGVGFADTYAAFSGDPSPCRVSPADTPRARQLELLAFLLDPTATRGLWMSVDKTSIGSPSDNQGVLVHGADGIGVGVGTQSLLPEAGAPTVTEGPPGSYTFTGGAVQIDDESGPEADHVALACPNLDQVVAKVSQ